MDTLQPVAWMTEAEDGTPMLWPTRTEAVHYCADDEQPTALYTQPTNAALTDSALLDMAADFRSQYLHGGVTFDEFDALGFARAVELAHGSD